MSTQEGGGGGAGWQVSAYMSPNHYRWSDIEQGNSDAFTMPLYISWAGTVGNWYITADDGGSNILTDWSSV